MLSPHRGRRTRGGRDGGWRPQSQRSRPDKYAEAGRHTPKFGLTTKNGVALPAIRGEVARSSQALTLSKGQRCGADFPRVATPLTSRPNAGRRGDPRGAGLRCPSLVNDLGMSTSPERLGRVRLSDLRQEPYGAREHLRRPRQLGPEGRRGSGAQSDPAYRFERTPDLNTGSGSNPVAAALAATGPGERILDWRRPAWGQLREVTRRELPNNGTHPKQVQG